MRARLHANSEVVGTDESFFDDDRHNKAVTDLYHEKAGLLDGEEDSEVDLVSYAYQIWQDAITAEPGLKKTIEDMPNVVYTAKEHDRAEPSTQGALVYLRTASGTDLWLGWMRKGKRVTDSPYRILKAAECLPTTPAVPRLPNHHEIGRNSGQRACCGGEDRRRWPRQFHWRAIPDLRAPQAIHAGSEGHPLRHSSACSERLKMYTDIRSVPRATDILNRHMKTGVHRSGPCRTCHELCAKTDA